MSTGFSPRAPHTQNYQNVYGYDQPQETRGYPNILQNTAQTDPHLLEYLRSWQSRLGELRQDEGRLRSEHDARTKQLVGNSTRDIADRAAGANASVSEDLARRGIAGSGTEAGLRGGISEAAQREQARAASNIALEQNRDYENQRFARQQSLNNFLSSGLGAAGAISQNQLAQQQLGLEQYRTQGSQRSNDLNDFMNMFRFQQQYGLQPRNLNNSNQPRDMRGVQLGGS